MKVTILKPLSTVGLASTWTFAVVCTLLLCGCERRSYRASDLPAELQAPPNVSAHTLDLSKIGTSTSSSEIIQPGDLLNVAMASGLESRQEELTQWPLRVADDGSANIPLVGRVQLAGLPLRQADYAIRQASIERGIFRNPNVAVSVEKPQSNRVSVVGAVIEPGPYDLPVASSDLLSAIAAAGGLAEDADTIVEIRRPGRSQPSRDLRNRESDGITTAAFRGHPTGMAASAQRVDLVSATAGEPADYHLDDGSVVMVMKRPKRTVYVGGLVKEPDQYEMPVDSDLYLLEALSMAGGRTLEIADKVTIIRRPAGGAEPITIKASVRKAQNNGLANLKLAPGDVVNVDETTVTFTVQTLKDFVRFGFSTGLPLF